MVQRFQGRSFSVTNDNEHQGGSGQSGEWGSAETSKLALIWPDYNQAVQAIRIMALNFTALDELAWWDELVNALDGRMRFVGHSEETFIEPSYTEVRHQSMLNSLGISDSVISRKDVMRAWIAKESGGLYWGGGKPKNTPYRMTEGELDEHGSFGYNQVLFTFTQYGMNKCSDIDGVNLYHPKNNLLGQIAFASSDDGNCGRSLYLSFIKPRKFYVRFSDSIDDGNVQLVGYGTK